MASQLLSEYKTTGDAQRSLEGPNLAIAIFIVSHVRGRVDVKGGRAVCQATKHITHDERG